MNGYIVHDKEGTYYGAFFDIHSAAKFKYRTEAEKGIELVITRENKYRKQYITESVLNRTLSFMSRR